MALANLNALKNRLSSTFNIDDFNQDRCLPQEFKSLVTTIDSNKLQYDKYSVSLTSPTDLTIVFPNQWLFIAGYFCDYYNLLQEYKSKVYSVLGISGDDAKNKIKQCVNNPSYAESLFDSANYHSEDREYLVKFLSSAEWWGGGKGIERGDFFVSPILNMAHLINASQAYVAELCRYLAQNPDARSALSLPVNETPINNIDEPLQVIYYGAPGTGKSFTIDDLTDDDNSVRTTFHPDSDYASFVGAYKPTMEAVPINSIYGESVQYATGKNGHPGTEKKIVYKYVPQAFLKAYVAAWSDLDNPHYLVIEEINRGNCAQIFGDLFQLLDRNNSGSSSYAIHADDDIRQFLSTDSKGFANLSEEQKQAIADFVLVKDNRKRSEIGPKILSGELLLLPPNLRIWATMNTSDQSLFPIDSAFKRRWNWHYVPIEYDVKDWLLHVGDNYYRWGDFLRAINPIISELTESPDKQMGYFFAKPDEKHGDTQENNTISEDVFVNKVLFYLWTDVLKDFDAGKEPFLNTDTKRAYEFSDFFDSKHDYLEQFVGKLGISPIDGSEPVDEEATDKGSDYKSIEVSVDGQTETSMTKAMIAILQKAAPTHTFAEIEAAVSECITRGDDPIIKKIDNPAEYTKENRWNTTIIKSSDNICFVVTTMWQRQFLPMIKKLAQYFNVPFEVVNP